jgi:hypothetical protein
MPGWAYSAELRPAVDDFAGHDGGRNDVSETRIMDVIQHRVALCVDTFVGQIYSKATPQH